jgi:hypothetical protein
MVKTKEIKRNKKHTMARRTKTMQIEQQIDQTKVKRRRRKKN